MSALESIDCACAHRGWLVLHANVRDSLHNLAMPCLMASVTQHYEDGRKHLASMNSVAELVDITMPSMVAAATIGTSMCGRPAPSSLDTRVLAAPVDQGKQST